MLWSFNIWLYTDMVFVVVVVLLLLQFSSVQSLSRVRLFVTP